MNAVEIIVLTLLVVAAVAYVVRFAARCSTGGGCRKCALSGQCSGGIKSEESAEQQAPR
jgi:hypothetical protein